MKEKRLSAAEAYSQTRPNRNGWTNSAESGSGIGRLVGVMFPTRRHRSGEQIAEYALLSQPVQNIPEIKDAPKPEPEEVIAILRSGGYTPPDVDQEESDRLGRIVELHWYRDLEELRTFVGAVEYDEAQDLAWLCRFKAMMALEQEEALAYNQLYGVFNLF